LSGRPAWVAAQPNAARRSADPDTDAHAYPLRGQSKIVVGVGTDRNAHAQNRRLPL